VQLDERLYVVQDANYNVTALFDNAGNVVERYVYDRPVQKRWRTQVAALKGTAAAELKVGCREQGESRAGSAAEQATRTRGERQGEVVPGQAPRGSRSLEPGPGATRGESVEGEPPTESSRAGIMLEQAAQPLFATHLAQDQRLVLRDCGKPTQGHVPQALMWPAFVIMDQELL